MAGADDDARLNARQAPKINLPTLVIHGDHDLVPPECARNVADALSASRVVVLGECGHFSYLERPGEVFDAIVDFVRRC